jgi:peptide/nickel transport system substrate-binding protein
MIVVGWHTTACGRLEGGAHFGLQVSHTRDIVSIQKGEKTRMKVIWSLVICLLISVLVLAACAPAAEEKAAEEEVIKKEEVTKEEQAEQTTTEEGETKKDVTETAKEPEYGGWLTYCVSREPIGFDEGLGVVPWYSGIHLTNEELLRGDWTKGPGGTGELSFTANAMPRIDGWTGCLAESWELVDTDTLVFHLREGIYWQDKSPVNGREFVANDVVYTFNRNFYDPVSYLHKTYNPAGELPISIKAPDKYTVIVECEPGKAGRMLEACGDVCRIYPPEVIEEFGDMSDWENVVGTGPFILKDYVPGSALTLERNPNYWGMHPLYPEDRMPYLDGVNMLIIQDASTRLSAFRTAKIDALIGVSWEDRDGFLATNPELEEVRVLNSAPSCLFMRTDTEPFDDIRVRRAMSMAVNNEEIANEYYGGNAEVLAFPIAPVPGFDDMYTPLEQLPESTRELYEYHPDKAKQLLEEAGYPDGFQTEIVCYNAYEDLLSIYANYLGEIGIDMKLDVKEYGVYTSIYNSLSHTQMSIRYMSSVVPFGLYAFLPGRPHNQSIIDDPHISEVYQQMSVNVFDEEVRRPLMRDLTKYILDQCYFLQIPAQYSYTLWHPWLQGFYGQNLIGRNNHEGWPMYTWIDQDMK